MGQGEFTGDGTVDINDLTIVLAHYGQTAGSSGRPLPRPCPSPRPCCSPPPHWPAAWRMPGGDIEIGVWHGIPPAVVAAVGLLALATGARRRELF